MNETSAAVAGAASFAAIATGTAPRSVATLTALALLNLALQLAVVQPRLNRRSDRVVIAGEKTRA